MPTAEPSPPASSRPEPAQRPELAHLYVEERGEGPLLLFTHGGGDTADTWSKQSGVFAEAGWRTVVWDLRGHGRSARPHDAAFYSRETAMGDIEAFVGDEPAVLVGHSLGGYLSMGFCLRHPGLVRAMVLVATGPGFRDEKARAKWNDNVAPAMARFGAPPEAGGILAQHDSWVIDSLAEITVPVLQLIGERDDRFLGSTKYMAEKLGGPTTTLVVPDAGHHVHRHAPEVVNEAIAAFLAEHAPAGG